MRTIVPLFILLAGFCLSACEKQVVRRTPEGMAAHRRQLAPPEHDGALDGATLSAIPARAKGVGHVTAIDRVARTITIDHDPSPGSDWPAMRLTLPWRRLTFSKASRPGRSLSFTSSAAPAWPRSPS